MVLNGDNFYESCKTVNGYSHGYTLVNCYALGPTSLFRIDFSYTDRV